MADPAWDAEDSRISSVRWLPSTTENAFGPHVNDPRSGEILAMVSLPSFDANLFVNGISHADYKALQDNPSRPQFNRAVLGGVAPGSTLKPFLYTQAIAEQRRELLVVEHHRLVARARVTGIEDRAPKRFLLHAATPNPSRGASTVLLDLPEERRVSLGRLLPLFFSIGDAHPDCRRSHHHTRTHHTQHHTVLTG
mgnify:CR=1 FL=1